MPQGQDGNGDSDMLSTLSAAESSRAPLGGQQGLGGRSVFSDSRDRLNTQPIWELRLHAEHSSLSTSLCASPSKVSELVWCALEKIELELAALFRTLGVQLKLSTSLLKKSPSSYRVDSQWQLVGSHQIIGKIEENFLNKGRWSRIPNYFVFVLVTFFLYKKPVVSVDNMW